VGGRRNAGLSPGAVPKNKLGKKIGELTDEDMLRLNRAVLVPPLRDGGRPTHRNGHEAHGSLESGRLTPEGVFHFKTVFLTRARSYG
jgi:hypothetical protein